MGKDADDPFGRLFNLKQAITEVSSTMTAEQAYSRKRAEAEEVDDKLGWTIKCVRAAERGRAGLSVLGHPG